MRKWAIGVGAALVLVCLCVYGGISFTAKGVTTFWDSFWPGLWSNIIGVSVAAIIGIPIGFVINHSIVRLGEQRNYRRQAGKVKGLLENVEREVIGHRIILEELGHSYFPTQVAETAKPTSIGLPTVAGLRLPTMVGSQFLQDLGAFDIGEPLIALRVANYYWRVSELNRMLDLRVQQTQQPEIWDDPIRSLIRPLWLAQGNMESELRGAIAKLGEAAVGKKGPM